MAGKAISVDVTSVVQRWSNGSLADAGFLLSTLNPLRAYFDSKERAGGVRATLEVVTQDSTPVSQSTPAVILNLSKIPVVINKPGLYVLDRNWKISGYFEAPPSEIIRVEGTYSVDIDMRGYE